MEMIFNNFPKFSFCQLLPQFLSGHSSLHCPLNFPRNQQKTVLPVLPCDRAGFYLRHIQSIINNVRQHIVKSSALMMQFKENTDLMCILHIDWFLTHDHKTCGILSVIADILSQDLQSVKLSCLSAGNSCLRLVIVFFLSSWQNRQYFPSLSSSSPDEIPDIFHTGKVPEDENIPV